MTAVSSGRPLEDSFDPRTGKRKPGWISRAEDAPAGIIEVRYVDAAAVLPGSFPIRFDPTAALTKGDRERLRLIHLQHAGGMALYHK